eukprot:scaffold42312_cov96-Cyclotella_meneghiniana.AAC.2
MHEKLLRLKHLDESVTPAQYQLMHNKWDNELGDFMASAEDQCTKFKSSLIEYSPTVGVFIKRRSILKWILRWYDGKVPDVRNLLRAAKWNNVENPLTTSREDIEARLVACIGHLMELKKIAPELRRKHLLSCLIEARKRGDDTAVAEILRRLLEEIGQFAEKEAAASILDGSYEFPEGTDCVLIELLQEAARLRVEFEGTGMDDSRLSLWKTLLISGNLHGRRPHRLTLGAISDIILQLATIQNLPFSMWSP